MESTRSGYTCQSEPGYDHISLHGSIHKLELKLLLLERMLVIKYDLPKAVEKL